MCPDKMTRLALGYVIRFGDSSRSEKDGRRGPHWINSRIYVQYMTCSKISYSVLNLFAGRRPLSQIGPGESAALQSRQGRDGNACLHVLTAKTKERLLPYQPRA